MEIKKNKDLEEWIDRATTKAGGSNGNGIICRLYGCLLASGRKTCFMEFGELLKGKYFLPDFRRKYLLINVSVTILSSRKDSSEENIFFSQILVNWKGYRIIWLYGGVLDSKIWDYLTVWMEFGLCGLLPRQETVMGMELFGDCMDFWSFVYERTVVRAGIFPKKLFSLANSSKLRGKWSH